MSFGKFIWFALDGHGNDVIVTSRDTNQTRKKENNGDKGYMRKVSLIDHFQFWRFWVGALSPLDPPPHPHGYTSQKSHCENS